MTERPTAPRKLLTPREAAAYLGCSEAHFEAQLRPHVPVVDLSRPGASRPMPRFDVADLDEFIGRRKRGGTVAA
jgi:hypothetical protein